MTCLHPRARDPTTTCVCGVWGVWVCMPGPPQGHIHRSYSSLSESSAAAILVAPVAAAAAAAAAAAPSPPLPSACLPVADIPRNRARYLEDTTLLGINQRKNMSQIIDLGFGVSSSIPDYAFKVR